MFRSRVIDFKGSWDDHLPLIELCNNNSYHSSISMAPFEAFCSRRCRSHVRLFEIGESSLLGPKIIFKAIGKIRVIRDRLKTTYSRKKSYVKDRRKNLEFKIDDHVYLKISPFNGVM